MIQITDVTAIPDARAGETITVKRARGALARLFGEPELAWRASACAELLVRGWIDIRASGDEVVARG